ncbi:hypothetical protein AMR42_00025 [Limnothrix sp. PR1529]|uniref:hypothetical protein n=1 Tax=Limnothrix sp. PR1529 TaxID=1704291 RepID=UPI00081F6979|nr:hypothetical protein [Limnothrix sp. PR1529]OCQ94059.1 hypothetical protein BCR12_05960 [Limnothrix sp. P13C2]PIB15775.1 hypothetical protein AMR42_00025 [Limnothrix sp. PR1529]
MSESQRAEILTRLLEAMIVSPKYQSASVSQMFRDAQSLADDIESDTNRRQKQERRSAYEPEPTASFVGKRWAKLNPDAVSCLQQEIREVAGLCAKLSRIDSDITPEDPSD